MDYLQSLWVSVWPWSTPVEQPAAAEAKTEPEVAEPTQPDPEVTVPEPVIETEPAFSTAPSTKKRKRRARKQIALQTEEDESDKAMKLAEEFHWRERNGGLTSVMKGFQSGRNQIKYPVKKRFELSEHKQRYRTPNRPIETSALYPGNCWEVHANKFAAKPSEVKKDRYIPRAPAKNFL